MTTLDPRTRKKKLPPQALLLERLRYEPETGRLFWRPRTSASFDTPDSRGADWVANQYNARHAGREAFTTTDDRGYRHGRIDGVAYQAHRVIWKLLTGIDPDTVDHINGKQGDNRADNLRECSNADNSRNYAKPKNASGFRGVSWVKRDGKYAARISAGDRGKHSLGHYDDPVEAALAYDRAARELHGQFATLNFPDQVPS